MKRFNIKVFSHNIKLFYLNCVCSAEQEGVLVHGVGGGGRHPQAVLHTQQPVQQAPVLGCLHQAQVSIFNFATEDILK